MVGVRVTKYDPHIRGIIGAYDEQWTSVSDIGGVWGGRRLTSGSYLHLEAMYVIAVQRFMASAGIRRLRVTSLQIRGGGSESRPRQLFLEFVSYRGSDSAQTRVQKLGRGSFGPHWLFAGLRWPKTSAVIALAGETGGSARWSRPAPMPLTSNLAFGVPSGTRLEGPSGAGTTRAPLVGTPDEAAE